MKRQAAALTLATSVLLSSTALASNEGAYFGAKLGKAQGDLSSLQMADIDGDNLGFFGGYSFDGGFAIEVEKNSMDLDLFGATMNVDTLAVYAASRLGDELFFKVKAGFLSEDVSITGFPEADITDSGMSYGIGAGFQTEHFITELEYTIIEADVSLISLGFAYRF